MDENKEVSDIFENKKKRKKWKTYLAVIMAIIFLGGLCYVASKFFFIYQGCEVQESKMYSADEIISSLGIKEKTPIFELDRKKLAEDLQATHPYLTDVKISFILPKKLNVTFAEDVGDISVLLGDDEFFVNKELMVIKKKTAEDKEYHRIKLLSEDIKKCMVGQKMEFFSENIADSLLDMINCIDQKNIISSVDEINIKDQFGIKIKYLSRFDVLLGEGEDITYKLDMMIRLSKELENNIIAEIDVADAKTAYVRVTGNIEE